jgi:hypothetical protein
MDFVYENGGKVLKCKDTDGDWIDFHYSGKDLLVSLNNTSVLATAHIVLSEEHQREIIKFIEAKIGRP